MMPTSASPRSDQCQPGEPSAHQAGQDPECPQEKPPAANFLVPLVTTDEDIHGQVLSPENQQFPAQTSSSSPATTSEDEKEKDVELGRANSNVPQVNHETPVEPIGAIVVDWESPEDPSNPVNWSAGLKWANIGVVSAITFIT